MKKSSLTIFIQSVQNSLLLSPIQKREFMDKPELLPEEYRRKLLSILHRFEVLQRSRYVTVQEALKKNMSDLKQNLAAANISTEEQDKVLKKIEKHTKKIMMANNA